MFERSSRVVLRRARLEVKRGTRVEEVLPLWVTTVGYDPGLGQYVAMNVELDLRVLYEGVLAWNALEGRADPVLKGEVRVQMVAEDLDVLRQLSWLEVKDLGVGVVVYSMRTMH